MRYIVFLLTLSCLLFSCGRTNEIGLKVKGAEELARIGEPDSAFRLLSGIANPEVLDDKTFARYCLTYAELSERLGEDMPFVRQMERASAYYEKQGTVDERINSLLYLGMSYEEETDFEWAMKSYLRAVEQAKEAKRYLSLGKLYHKIAGLHDFDNNYDEAKCSQLLSGEYYLRGNDSVSYIYSLRDMAWLHVFEEEYEEAIEYLEKAYRLALPINDSLLLSSLTNRLGVTYVEMGDYVSPEKYLLKSIAYDEAGSAPTFLALGDLYLYRKEYDKVRKYIKKAASYKTDNRMLPGGILYQYYLLEKALGNYSLSLDYYERYTSFSDSILMVDDQSNVLKVQKRYEHERLLSAMKDMTVKNQWILIICILLFMTICFSFIWYKYRAYKDKSERIKVLNDANKRLQEKEFKEKGLNTLITNIRENMLKDSDVYKKVYQNAGSLQLAEKNMLTDQEWLTLEELLKTVYPFFFDNLKKHFPDLTEAEKRFCCLLKLGLNNSQLAIFFNIQPNSVIHKRYRIMKKGHFENTKTTLDKIISEL